MKNKMKILIIDPPFKVFSGLLSMYFPLGAAYVAGALKKAGYDCAVFDVDAAKPEKGSLNFSEEYERYAEYIKALNNENHHVWALMKRIILEQKPDVIGITALTTKFGSVIQTARLCRQILPDVPIVAGGAQASSMPELTASIEEIDFVLRSESDETMPLLVDKIVEGSGFEQVNGLTWKKNGKIINNPDVELAKNLDSLALPDRSSLLFSKNYSSEDMGVILTSRGCPFRCSYCFHMWDRKVRYRSVDSVIEEIISVYNQYKTTQFSIKDDSFTIKKEHVMELCEALAKLPFKITFNCTTRVDILDEELIKAMKKAGLAQLSIGVESGSKKVLAQTDKDITHEQILQASRLLNNNGVFWTGYFMIGLPEETEEDILKTIRFMHKIKPYYAGLGVYNPFPGTKLFNQAIKMGILNPNPDPEHFLKTNPKDLFFIDPKKRTLYIEHDRFAQLSEMASLEFHKHNTRLFNLMRRAFARRRVYMYDPAMFKSDFYKGLQFLGIKK